MSIYLLSTTSQFFLECFLKFPEYLSPVFKPHFMVASSRCIKEISNYLANANNNINNNNNNNNNNKAHPAEQSSRKAFLDN